MRSTRHLPPNEVALCGRWRGRFLRSSMRRTPMIRTRTTALTFATALSIAGCDGNPGAGTDLTVENQRSVATTVYVSFGADSKVTGGDWAFCEGEPLSCSFQLDEKASKSLPNATHAYLNATFSFDKPVGCGTTKAELNINNPSWYDVLNVSLVDGYSNKIQITTTPTGKDAVRLGPPSGATGNQKIYGLFPFGCDICVERENPPCGISKGKHGCKSGTQYDPDVPCQWQGPTKSGGGHVTISLLR